MLTYKQLFANLNRPAFVPFFVLGDPNYNESLRLIKAAIDAGADVLELGIPFSDPTADGPTIQKADVRALESGMTCKKALNLIAEIKQYRDIPIGLLMYYNIIEKYGREKFYLDAARAGVNSVLVADLCVDDADEVQPLIEKAGLDSVYMVTPNTAESRRDKIARLCTGFIYTVSTLGVTGARAQLSDLVLPLVHDLKQRTPIPVCVGFGVSQPDHARQLAAAGVDGVIVGSAIVNIIDRNLNNLDMAESELKQLIADMKAALE